MRLIDADELLEQLATLLEEREKEAAYTGSREINVRWDDAIISIKDAPTIDPVKHGRWIHEVDTGADMLKCSECSCRVALYWYKLAVGTAGYEYCPYCGAMMDEEDDHDDHL